MRNLKLDFCSRLVYLKNELIDFQGRPYLSDIYDSRGNIAVRASRQVEKSTFLANTIAFEAASKPGICILYACPRMEQALQFVRSRLLPMLQNSPLLRRHLLGKFEKRRSMKNMQFANGSQLNVRAAFHSADSCRGISAELLLVDEFQDIAAGDLPVLQECLSHAPNGRTMLTGTPKLLENHLEGMFNQSTANEWTIDCPMCGKGAILDERCLGTTGIICPDCQCPLDAARGRWVPRNPAAAWGHGFWINSLMVPWFNYDDVLSRQVSYDLSRFKNEVLGLPTSLGTLVVTREELEKCCTDQPMAVALDDIPHPYREHVIAGIDWGGGVMSRTIATIGWMSPDYVFHVGNFARFRADEDPELVLESVAALCRKFGVRLLAADGGGSGSVYNRLLLERLGLDHGMYAIIYSSATQQPRNDGLLFKWTVDRTASIGSLFGRIKKRMLQFPRATDCGSFLDEFACEVAEFDDQDRRVRYTHPATMPDDALHATNYALLLAYKLFEMSAGNPYD